MLDAGRKDAGAETISRRNQIFGELEATPVANAPAAVAAFIGVMLAGAGFLWVAVGESAVAPESAPPPLDPSPLIAEAAPHLAPPTLKVSAAPPSIVESDDPIEALIAAEAQIAVASKAPLEPTASSREIVSGFGVAPNLKPPANPATSPLTEFEKTSKAPAAVIPLASAFLAAEADRPAPVFFADDLAPTRVPPPPLAVAYAADLDAAPEAVSVRLAKGETFVDALRRAGVGAADRNAAAYAFGAHQNLRQLRPGQEFRLTTTSLHATVFEEAAVGLRERRLLSLEFKPDQESIIALSRTADAGFAAHKSSVELSTRLMSVKGRIVGSLYASAKAQGAPDKVIADLANMFAYDVDFQREVFGGDEFEAIFEIRYDDRGRAVGAGDILFGRMKWRGRSKEKGYYLFASTETGKADYFDAAGQSAKRLLMKTPIDGARLSSGFGTRKHPILGYARAHKGVDFAAPRGTPIKAAGDGVVERADRYGSFGNYVRIRHANGYETAYAHLNGFAKGMRAGKRVDQGDIIGYVGTTGRSTGPHLHYEVHFKGGAVNPQNLKIATGVQLRGDDLKAFQAVRGHVEAMRAPEPEASPLMANEGDSRAAL